MQIKHAFEFSATHEIASYKGKPKPQHEHTYKLVVTIKGEPNEEGMVMDFYDLKTLIENEIIKKLHNSFINNTIENPTTETMAKWIFETLQKKCNVTEIKLYPKPECCVVYP